jgi:drug/metabolite transporter (DMT)-like permease
MVEEARTAALIICSLPIWLMVGYYGLSKCYGTVYDAYKRDYSGFGIGILALFISALALWLDVIYFTNRPLSDTIYHFVSLFFLIIVGSGFISFGLWLGRDSISERAKFSNYLWSVFFMLIGVGAVILGTHMLGLWK